MAVAVTSFLGLFLMCYKLGILLRQAVFSHALIFPLRKSHYGAVSTVSHKQQSIKRGCQAAVGYFPSSVDLEFERGKNGFEHSS